MKSRRIKYNFQTHLSIKNNVSTLVSPWKLIPIVALYYKEKKSRISNGEYFITLYIIIVTFHSFKIIVMIEIVEKIFLKKVIIIINLLALPGFEY